MTNNEKYQKAIDDLVETHVQEGDIRVTLEYLGEGLGGDYTGEEDDVPLMRFYTFKRFRN